MQHIWTRPLYHVGVVVASAIPVMFLCMCCFETLTFIGHSSFVLQSHWSACLDWHMHNTACCRADILKSLEAKPKQPQLLDLLVIVAMCWTPLCKPTGQRPTAQQELLAPIQEPEEWEGVFREVHTGKGVGEQRIGDNQHEQQPLMPHDMSVVAPMKERGYENIRPYKPWPAKHCQVLSFVLKELYIDKDLDNGDVFWIIWLKSSTCQSRLAKVHHIHTSFPWQRSSVPLRVIKYLLDFKPFCWLSDLWWEFSKGNERHFYTFWTCWDCIYLVLSNLVWDKSCTNLSLRFKRMDYTYKQVLL